MSEASPSSAPEAVAQASRVAGVGVLELVLVSGVLACAAVATYHFFVLPERLPRFATVDLPAIYREHEAAFTQVVTREGVSEGERAAAFRRAEAFARDLPVALDALAEQCRCTVLAGNAVAGRYVIADLTPALRARVAR